MRGKCPVIFFCAFVYFVAELNAQICERVQVVTSTVQVTYKTSYHVINNKWVHYIERKNVPKRERKTIKFCCPGYIRTDDSVDDSDIVCEPICLQACRNGRCKSPGECECNNGYIPDPKNDHNCFPSCKEDCGHGVCVAPDTCQCNFGYTLVNDTCQPICTDSCPNGTCIAPETCACLVGYRKFENSICQPYCSHGCDNGVCIAPETCQCNPGWHLQESRHLPYKQCLPVCSKPCENGNCVAPETCDCWPSYKKSNGRCEPICPVGWVSENGQCLAQCSHPCGNGKCVAPNACVCHSGYHIDTNYSFSFIANPNATMCVPKCTGCTGRCVAPDKCEGGLISESQSIDDYYYDDYGIGFLNPIEITTSSSTTTSTTTTTTTARPTIIPVGTTTTVAPTTTTTMVPTTTTTMSSRTSTIAPNPRFNETNEEKLEKSWAGDRWMHVVIPILVVITVAILAVLLLAWRYTPIRTFFKGGSYVVEGEPVQTSEQPPSENIQIADVKI